MLINSALKGGERQSRYLAPRFSAEGKRGKSKLGFSPIKIKVMSYVRIWIHCVWGTKNRTPYLNSGNKNEIFRHIKENAKVKGIYLDFINGYKDHVHCTISLGLDQTIMKVMQMIKGESSNWINKNNLVEGKFEWADEYYAVSVSESAIQNVRNYIKNQEEHHKVKTWDEECSEFMEKYGFKEMKG